MRKVLFFILLLGIMSQKIFAQNMEQNILELLYHDIKKQNEYWSIKEKLKGVILVSDPINGVSEIKYSKNIDEATKRAFSKLNKNKQLEILSCPGAFVSFKDTLIIVDTIGFFPEKTIGFNPGSP